MYYSLLTDGKMNCTLAGIDRQAEELFSRLMKQMAEREGVTEAVKARDQMALVGRIFKIRNACNQILSAQIVVRIPRQSE